MFHQKLKQILNDSITAVASDISSYVRNPLKDFSRNKKISAEQMLSFLISQGASSTKCEWLDFFQLSPDTPSASAMNQRRSQLLPSAYEAVFHNFTLSAQNIDSQNSSEQYRYIAADGSDISFFSSSRFSSDDYYISEGHSKRGFYSIHINAFYDLKQKIYTDAFLQSAHDKDEFLAFCQLVDRCPISTSSNYIFIGDRGYCSYNNMAHVIEKGQYFLFRTKDIHSKGLVGNFRFPDSDEFDISVHVTLIRSKRKSIKIKENSYCRFVDKETSFDYIQYGSSDIYELSFRVVRFRISENTYECIVTNLPSESFPTEKIKETYNARWGIESSFRKLKYTIGLNHYHGYKADFIQQEIWAKLTAYNATELLVSHTVLKTGNRKYVYAVNFTIAAHICRIYLRLHAEIDDIDVMVLLKKELVPIREERQFERLKTAHFRKPKYPIYRAA